MKNVRDIKLLYVDDDTFTREHIILTFERAFKDVIICEDGEQAYELYKKENPDIILTDLEMPVMDGRELLAKIREEDKDIPIIVITAFDTETYGIEKASHVCFKPIKIKQLLAKIDELTS